MRRTYLNIESHQSDRNDYVTAKNSPGPITFTSTCTQEMEYNLLAEENFECLHPLWSMEPRIFAMETSASGKRKYIVGNLGRFLNHYWRKSDPLNRHYYELIRENTPCRLYFGMCSLH